MSTRTEVRAERADPEDGLYAVVPVFIPVVMAIGITGFVLFQATVSARHGGEHVLLGILFAAAAFGCWALWRAASSPTLFLPVVSVLLPAEAVLARLVLPDPRLGTTAHDRLQRHAAMTRARRRLRRLGLGSDWIRDGAAVLDRRGRVRLLRRS
jgi:hypothetical protein